MGELIALVISISLIYIKPFLTTVCADVLLIRPNVLPLFIM